MKKAMLTMAVIMMIIATSCKEDATQKIKAENVEMAANRDEKGSKLPVMMFEKTEHDFGNIVQGTAVETIFKFKNTGEAPLIITNAKSSCGCTIPEYPKDEAIAPGDTGELLVKFNGAGKNKITKVITVTANTAKGSEKIQIKAFVTPKEKGDTK